VIILKNNFSFDVGERLRELRQARAMSQEQVAHIADITPAYLGQVERGTKNITVLTLEKACNALNISLAEFFSMAKNDSNDRIDEVGSQILHQLHNRSEAEKQAILKLIKLVFSVKEMS
jgi:transcriptional regulator with XRE-family HTH domain